MEIDDDRGPEKMTLPISVIILTYNEEKNIEKCLKSIHGWTNEIFIVDSFSTDKTLNIVKKFTNKVFQHPFETHSKQWMWALKELPVKNKWILGLDADQQITPELAKELQILFFSQSTESVDGYYIKRRQYFMGRWIKHGGYYPVYLLKLFKKNAVRIDSGELMDHHFYVKWKTKKLKNDLIEDNRNETLDFWTNKHNTYSTLQAKENIYNLQNNIKSGNIIGNRDDRRLAIKNIWIRMPLFIRSLLYFLYRYFIRMGFLDGKEGLIFHFLQAFWYRFLVDAKIFEIKKVSIRK